jgi:predicted ATPase/DNA-binding winged helix-turn-helix (wHTH) protein
VRRPGRAAARRLKAAAAARSLQESGVPTLRFGRHELDPSTRELRADGTALRIGERAFDLLHALAEAGGAPVARDVLFERVWPGRAVLDDNLKVQVMALRRLLGSDAVVTVPGQGYRLGIAPAADAPAAPAAAPALFGRDADLARVTAALAPGRVVSIVGPGGIGKTRLAQAAVAADRRADGALFVELAPLADGRRLAATVARALVLPPGSGEAALLAALRPLQLLLVLDNAEHLRADVAAFVVAALAAAPQVALLVTSQEPLGVGDETVLRLDGLAAGAAGALFAARARALDPEFMPDAAAQARLCERLEGIPLALEFAAARVPLLGVAGVERKLGEALALLTRGAPHAPARQQTLRGALQWSHGLLDEAQKAVFRRLAVFAGSFEPTMAEAVAADAALDGWAVLDALEALADKSLLQRLRADGRPRLRLPEAARQFALERLDDAGEANALRRRHAESLAALFEDADERYNATPALDWLAPLQPELPNLRAAVDWALGLDGDEALAIRLCAGAGGFWAMTGLHAESGPPLLRLVPRVDALGVPPPTRARFWMAIANRSGDGAFSAAQTYEAVERTIEIARAHGLVGLLHRALGHRQVLAQRVGIAIDAAATAAEMRAVEGDDWNALQRRPRRQCEAFAWYAQAQWDRFGAAERQELALLREAGDLYRAWFAAHRLALAETALGRPREAAALMQQAVDEIRAHGLTRHCWQQVAILAMTLIESGDAPPALVHEAVRLMRGARAMAWMATHLAEWLAQQRRDADAARVIGWCARRQAERGEAGSAHAAGARDRTLAALRTRADAAQIAAWQAEGEGWNDDDVAVALLA